MAEIEFKKPIHIGRQRSLVRDRALRIDEGKRTEAMEDMIHVYLDEIAHAIRQAAKLGEGKEERLSQIADHLDRYQAAMLLRIIELTPCRRCAYFRTLQDTAMIKEIDVFESER